MYEFIELFLNDAETFVVTVGMSLVVLVGGIATYIASKAD